MNHQKEFLQAKISSPWKKILGILNKMNLKITQDLLSFN